MSEDKFYINCPYNEKDEAKLLGARWDADKRKWYIPFDSDRSKFKKWISNSKSQNHLRVIK